MNLRKLVTSYQQSGNNDGKRNCVILSRKPGIDALNRMELTCKISTQLYNKTLAKVSKPMINVVNVYESPVGRGACIVHEVEKVLYFCFRGANGLEDITSALFSANPVVFSPDRSMISHQSSPSAYRPVLVHKGFKDIYMELKDKMVHDLKFCLRNIDIKRIVCAGHSMGGSVAMLLSVDAGSYAKLNDKQIELHTFGTPKTGNKAFLDLIPYESYFLRHPYDIVPLVNLNEQLLTVEGIVFPTCIPGDDNTNAAACETERVPGLSELLRYHSTATYLSNITYYRDTLKPLVIQDI